MRFALLALALFLGACTYDSATDTWRINIAPDSSHSDTDSLWENLAIQRYMRDHHGKMPPPDYPLYP